ncbi:MAG TPA: methyltransferase domain-containing protein [Gammaproteobacteria bacterium]|nr:methyltransferase domain-containing protein [Gammaproteobacteria bacterium]
MKYSEVADEYKKIAKNQASAGEELISLIFFKGQESILDLGCGTGHLAFELSKKTSGRVIGIDPSEGMIRQAKKSYGEFIKFVCEKGENMAFTSQFDVIFCNSVFHWFKDPVPVLKKIHQALKNQGVFALQTPVTEWCDFIVDAIDQTCKSDNIKQYMEHYLNPWFHLKNASAYQALLEYHGFNVRLAFDEDVTTQACDFEKIVGLFNSGPALAYLNFENYSIPCSENFKNNFIDTLHQIIRQKMGNRTVVDITYHRAFLIACKYDGIC